MHHSGDTLPLQAAQEIARENNSDWYIVQHQGDLNIAKLIVADRLRFIRVVHDDGRALRFTSPAEAREFLKTALSVPRASLYLEQTPSDVN